MDLLRHADFDLSANVLAFRTAEEGFEIRDGRSAPSRGIKSAGRNGGAPAAAPAVRMGDAQHNPLAVEIADRPLQSRARGQL
jgi:hypothetical protein